MTYAASRASTAAASSADVCKTSPSDSLGEGRRVAPRPGDDDLRDPRLERLEAGDELRAHPARDGARVQELPRRVGPEPLDELSVRVEDALDVREEDEPLGLA